ncbi:MAG: hypothetical protein RBT72_09580 [Spirochaetia bacterium]|jgi:hypothetical protein|nr:hypothetical protein [Spirochaetia bacterium]
MATDYVTKLRELAEVPHLLSLGAGVQSSTLALMAAAGEVTPMPTAAIFADTQAEDENYECPHCKLTWWVETDG